MKKMLIGSILCMMALLGGYCANAQIADAGNGTPEEKQETTRVYFYEFNEKNMPTYAPIYMNGYKIADLKKGCYTYIDVKPGLYNIGITGARAFGHEANPMNVNIYLEKGDYFAQIYLSARDGEEYKKYAIDSVPKEKANEDMQNLKYVEYEREKKPAPSENKALMALFDGIEKKDIHSESPDTLYRDKNFDFNTIGKIFITPLIDAREERKFSLEKLFSDFKTDNGEWDEHASHILEQIRYELINKGYLSVMLNESADNNIKNAEDPNSFDVLTLSKIGGENSGFIMFVFVDELKYFDFLHKAFHGIKLTFALMDKDSKKLLWVNQGSIMVEDFSSTNPYPGGIFGVMESGAHASIDIGADKGISAVENGLKNFPESNNSSFDVDGLLKGSYVEYTINYVKKSFTLSEKDFEKRKNNFVSKLKDIGFEVREKPDDLNYVVSFVFNDVSSAGFTWTIDNSYFKIVNSRNSEIVLIVKNRAGGTDLNEHEKNIVKELERIIRRISDRSRGV